MTLLLAVVVWRRGNEKAPVKTSPAASHATFIPGSAPIPSVDQADADPVAAFTHWTKRFLAAGPEEKTALEAEGLRWATERRPVMKDLIRNDPREALRQAVPMVVRQQLPRSVLALLEERVNEVGTLRVYQGTPLEGEPLPSHSLTIRRAELRTGKTYDAHVYGRRAERVAWTSNASLNGVAIDTDFAVNEGPYRKLEVGELPNGEKPVSSICPVSGKNAAEPEAAEEPVAEETPAIETATETIFFCDGSHITLYGETLIMGEGSSGGAIGFTGILPAVPTPSIGVVRVLYIPTTYLDQNAVPSTEAKSYELLRDVSDFYAKSSYGKLTLVSTVTPPVKLPHTEAWYIQRDTSNGGDIDGEGFSHSHMRATARRMGFDDANYDCVVMRHQGGPGSSRRWQQRLAAGRQRRRSCARDRPLLRPRPCEFLEHRRHKRDRRRHEQRIRRPLRQYGQFRQLSERSLQCAGQEPDPLAADELRPIGEPVGRLSHPCLRPDLARSREPLRDDDREGCPTYLLGRGARELHQQSLDPARHAPRVAVPLGQRQQHPTHRHHPRNSDGEQQQERRTDLAGQHLLGLRGRHPPHHGQCERFTALCGDSRQSGGFSFQSKTHPRAREFGGGRAGGCDGDLHCECR